MKQFLYQIKPTRVAMLTAGPSEHESKIVAEHFEYLQGLVAKGVVLMAGRTLAGDELWRLPRPAALVQNAAERGLQD
jgi:uncharacterized protein YciI